MSLAPSPPAPPATLELGEATTYADWFACLAEPTRVRLLHIVATAPSGSTSVGELADGLGISQSTASHHVRRLSDAGFVTVHKRGTTSVVAVNAACCTGLPHAADVVMGALTTRPCCPTDLPSDVGIRPMSAGDLNEVRRIYAEGIATGDATFETRVPAAGSLQRRWLEGHRWVAEVDDVLVGWAAAAATSDRECYAGVAETSVYVAGGSRGRGVGKALLHRQVNAADDDGLWTLQTSVFPENRASVALHHAAGFRTIGVRERIGRLAGRWRDTVLLERRSEVSGQE